jgi:hypothetical protein
MLYLVILILLIVLLFGTGPWYPYSRSWGYQPMGVVGILLILLLVLLIAGALPPPRW